MKKMCSVLTTKKLLPDPVIKCHCVEMSCLGGRGGRGGGGGGGGGEGEEVTQPKKKKNQQEMICYPTRGFP